MATIIFYEKPGCANNARQKRLLMDAGHVLEVHNLLETRWAPQALRAFFGQRPVSEWFNRAAPRIKSGEVNPEVLDEATALALMMADPLLIRRPLMQMGERREAGFDAARLQDWLCSPQITEETVPIADFERCVRTHQCPSPETAR